MVKYAVSRKVSLERSLEAGVRLARFGTDLQDHPKLDDQGVKSFRGRLVLQDRSIDGLVLTLGEFPIPGKPGRVDWWGQVRLDQQLRQSVGEIRGEASIELEDGRRGQIVIADFRRENGLARFSGKGDLK